MIDCANVNVFLMISKKKKYFHHLLHQIFCTFVRFKYSNGDAFN